MKPKRIILFILIFSLMISFVFSIDYAEEFKKRNGEEWYVEVTPDGLILLAYRLRPDEIESYLSREDAIQTAKNFLDENSELIGLENFNYNYDQLNEEESFTYWTIDFKGEIIYGITPPHSYVRVFMTRDGQVYAIGDIDSFTIGVIEPFQRDTIPENEAVEEAKKTINSEKDPTDISLVTNLEIDNVEYPLVWDVKFGDPDDKEVLVDAKTGEVLTIKSTKTIIKLGTLSRLLSNPVILISVSIVIIGVVFIMFFMIKRVRKLGEKEAEMKDINYS